MTDCKNAIDNLFDYLCKEMDASDADELARHLELCRKCYDRAEFEKALRDRIREKAGACRAPERLAERIRGIMDRLCSGEQEG